MHDQIQIILTILSILWILYVQLGLFWLLIPVVSLGGDADYLGVCVCVCFGGELYLKILLGGFMK